ncbi:MAG: MFS transporter [Chloroflexota bacterium]|nr:MAG: MFS transporter [Chloroflexota bacterium]
MTPSSPSYRALLEVPSLGRALAGMHLVRIAQSMIGVALVLFCLGRYGSPAIAGLVTFASVAPGLLISPIGGALLDRHGRTRLILLDLVIATVAIAIIAVLAVADALPAGLLVLIAAISSLTGPLGATGMRTLFPLMVPPALWERVNAIDANGYVVASIIGPPLAAVMVGAFGGPVALLAIAVLLGVGAVILRPVPEPPAEVSSTGRLLTDAWLGLRYTWANRTLRGLGLSITTLNLGSGMVSIVVPLLVLDRLGLDEAAVGAVFAAQGVAGVVAGLLAGRIDTRGRETRLLAGPMVAFVPALALLLVPGLWPIVLSMVVMGLATGPMDVAMFTLRQRRTEAAWMGRAFAISMAFNFAGWPVGAAIAGLLAAVSLEAAVVLGVATTILAVVLAATLVPRDEPTMPAPASESPPAASAESAADLVRGS